MLPPVARGFILFVVGIAQVIPLAMATYLFVAGLGGVSGPPISARTLTAGVAFLGTAGATLFALYRDLRYREPFNRSSAFVVSLVLVVVGVVLLRP